LSVSGIIQMQSSPNNWSTAERKLLRKLSTPEKIQTYLDSLSYNTDDFTRSAREVMRTGKAHCFDGAVMAAAALEANGERPLVLWMEASHDDDDHLLALYRRLGCWGAAAQSNFTGLRYRDPVYRTLRELVMSYFDAYFNLAGRKTLRAYYLPVDLRGVAGYDWRFSSQDIDHMDRQLKRSRRHRVISRRQEALLAPVDDRNFRADTLGLDPRAAHKVRGSRLN
jgi:hypothetical protein